MIMEIGSSMNQISLSFLGCENSGSKEVNPFSLPTGPHGPMRLHLSATLDSLSFPHAPYVLVGLGTMSLSRKSTESMIVQ